MRLVLDTNIFVSALLLQHSAPTELVELWMAGRFELISAEAQIEEIARVTRYPKLRARLRPALAGRLVNQLRTRATLVVKLPTVDVSPDPFDNYLLAMAQAGTANLLISGDKRDLLALATHHGTRIVTVSAAIELLTG